VTTETHPRASDSSRAALVAWERGLLVAGGLATALYGASIAQSRLYQAEAARAFDASIRERGLTAPVPGVPFSQRDFGPLLPSSSGIDAAIVDMNDWSPGKVRAYESRYVLGSPAPLARLQIPSIGLSAMVLEGTDETALIRGVGHIEGTALPGAPGNVGLAGHRDSFFRRLAKVTEGADVLLTTLEGRDLHYTVRSIDIVPPERVDVLDATDGESVTLVTCYPFYFIGSAPMRYVVRASRAPDSGVGVVTPWQPSDPQPSVK